MTVPRSTLFQSTTVLHRTIKLSSCGELTERLIKGKATSPNRWFHTSLLHRLKSSLVIRRMDPKIVPAPHTASNEVINGHDKILRRSRNPFTEFTLLHTLRYDICHSFPTPPHFIQVIYLCGQCGMNNALKPQDIIRCRECGYRILYKVRTKRCNAILSIL